jgi:hypothetical protein
VRPLVFTGIRTSGKLSRRICARLALGSPQIRVVTCSSVTGRCSAHRCLARRPLRVHRRSYADVTKQFVCPHVATVTYLSDFGAPTMAVTQRPIVSGSSEFRSAFVSHPRQGKHMSFDGRMLHGVPPELIAPRTPSAYTRITVLVNVWFNHLLHEVTRWPDTDVPLVSKAPMDDRISFQVCLAAAAAMWPAVHSGQRGLLCLLTTGRASRFVACPRPQADPRRRTVGCFAASNESL